MNPDIACRSEDWGHLRIGGLQANHVSFTIEAFEGSICAINEGDDDLSLAGGARAFDEDVVARDDVLVPHGVAPDLKGEDLAISDDVAEGDALSGLNGLDRLTGGDSSHQWKPVDTLFRGARGEDVDGAAAVVCALEETFVLEIRDMFMDGG